MTASKTLNRALAVVVTLMTMLLQSAKGHGYVIDPPQRASMWRAGFDTPVDYDDNQLFCGGFTRQWQANGGKCGICGDPYDDPERPHEAGGTYATGTIAKTYEKGDVINVTVIITANHIGYFIFKLCPNNNVKMEATQECLDQHVLQVANESGKPSGNRFYIDKSVGLKTVHLQLPGDITCTQCVLQWTYNTGNSWGCDNTSCCVGCGPQENFVNCVDIAITSGNDSNRPATTRTPNPTTLTATMTATTVKKPPTTEKPKVTTATTRTTTTTTTKAPLTTTTATTTTKKPDGKVLLQCHAIGIYANIVGMHTWCTNNCLAQEPVCPASHCLCQ